MPNKRTCLNKRAPSTLGLNISLKIGKNWSKMIKIDSKTPKMLPWTPSSHQGVCQRAGRVYLALYGKYRTGTFKNSVLCYYWSKPYMDSRHCQTFQALCNYMVRDNDKILIRIHKIPGHFQKSTMLFIVFFPQDSCDNHGTNIEKIRETPILTFWYWSRRFTVSVMVWASFSSCRPEDDCLAIPS